MNRLFKKYFHSVITPDEFSQFCSFMKEERNNTVISEMMKPEWERCIREEKVSRQNPALLEKIKQAILIKEGESARIKLRLYTIAMRVAALLIIGLFAGNVWFYLQSRSSSGLGATQSVSIPYGARTQLSMPDGSTVWLNSGSTLTYPVDFSKHRHVMLDGEAFFDVVKRRGPFEVSTNYGKVIVHGTAFNVQAFSDGNFVTTLVRGKVQIINNGGQGKEFLYPGEQASLVGEKFEKRTVDTELYTSWKDGRLIFYREPFPSMIDKMERWFNVDIEYSGLDFKGLWFSGTIENETLTEVMEMICKSASVNYSYNSKTRRIKITANKKDV